MVAGPLFQCNAGVKQLYRQLISLFQSMPEHFCAQASSTRNSRRRFLVDIRGCLCSGTNIRSEKYCIGIIFHSCRHAPRGAPGHKQLLKSFFHRFYFSALFNMLQYLQEQHHSTEHERRGGILGRTLKCDAALSSTNKWDIEPGLLDLAISQFLFSHRRQTLLLFLYFSVRVVIFL